MARPTKFRRVEYFPNNNYFIPKKKELQGGEVTLKVEELEAMRLKDVLGLNQEECAERMNVSRQTFQNIIDNARKNVALALIEGKAINIRGGNYTPKHCRITCLECGDTYEINYEKDFSICPICNSGNIQCKMNLKICNEWCRTKKDKEF